MSSQLGFFVPGEPRTGDTRRNPREDQKVKAPCRRTTHGLTVTLLQVKNSNADRISELCFIACPRTGVLQSSDDTL